MEYYDLDQTQKEHKHAEAQRLPRGAVGAACINDKTEYLVNTSTNFCTLFTPHKPAIKTLSVVRRLTVGPTGLLKPARDSNPESSDVLLIPVLALFDII